MDASLERALSDAQSLVNAGFDGVLIENMHDFPPLREAEMGPDVAAYMAVIARELRHQIPDEIPVGIQVLFAAHRTAVAVAAAAGLQFLRAESWTYGHLSDKGWVEASAAGTVRYARSIGAEHVAVWADAKKKHASHAISADLDVADVVANLELHRASAAILTGATTGEAPDPDDFRRAGEKSSLPLVLGSGLTVQNAPEFRGLAHAFIVGSSIKFDADWRAPVDLNRAKALVGALGH